MWVAPVCLRPTESRHNCMVARVITLDHVENYPKRCKQHLSCEESRDQCSGGLLVLTRQANYRLKPKLCLF